MQARHGQKAGCWESSLLTRSRDAEVICAIEQSGSILYIIGPDMTCASQRAELKSSPRQGLNMQGFHRGFIVSAKFPSLTTSIIDFWNAPTNKHIKFWEDLLYLTHSGWIWSVSQLRPACFSEYQLAHNATWQTCSRLSFPTLEAKQN